MELMYEWYDSPPGEKHQYKGELEAILDAQIEGTAYSRKMLFDFLYNNYFKEYARKRRQKENRSP